MLIFSKKVYGANEFCVLAEIEASLNGTLNLAR